MQGWIKLHRKLLSSNIFQNEKLLKVFIYCLLKASHKEREQIVGLQDIEIKQGQFVFGRSKAANELDMKESTVWKYMKFLEKTKTISLNSNNKFTVVTVDKWLDYQGIDDETEQQSNNKRTTKEQQSNTNKNVKNDKNVNKKDSRSKLKFETKHIQLADLLFKLIKKNNPNVKQPKLEQWADTFRKMMELDNRKGKDIQDIIIWCQKDSFWHTNILSADKLRAKFDELYLKMNNKPKHKEEPTGRYIPDTDEIDLTAGED